MTLLPVSFNSVEQFQLPKMLLNLALLLVLLSYAKADIVCPIPVRPMTVLQSIGGIENNLTVVDISLELRKCVDQKRKTQVFLRLVAASIGGRQRLLPNFNRYENYGPLPCSCWMQLNNKLAHKTGNKNWNQHDEISFKCDIDFMDCRVNEWKCPEFPREEFEAEFIGIIAEVFSDTAGKKNDTLKQDDQIPIRPPIFPKGKHVKEENPKSWWVYYVIGWIFSMLLGLGIFAVYKNW